MDVYYVIAPLEQPKSNDCWITSLTIINRWRNNNDELTILEVVEELGEPYRTYYDLNSGLPGSEIDEFYNKANIDYDNPQNYLLEQWRDLLKTKGPLLVDVLSFINNDQVWTHLRVLVGIELNRETPLYSTFVFIDPVDGIEQEQSYESFLRKYEAEPANQIDHIQVAYSK